VHPSDLNSFADFAGGGLIDVAVPNLGHRCGVAATHAWRTHDAHVGAKPGRQLGEQLLRSHHRAGETVAHAHGELGWRCLILDNDIEVGVEGSDLIDLGQRQAHLLRERGEVSG